MNIQKLTITPLEKGLSSYVTQNPTIESAGRLISERLLSSNGYYNREKPARALRKIPKWMKDFVNPETLVVKERKFDING